MNTLAVHLKNCLVMCTCNKNDNYSHCIYMHDHAKLIHNIVIILNSSLNQNITQWVKHEQFSNVLVVPCELFTIQNIPRHV